MLQVKPFDIVVFDSTGSILHKIIAWRSLDVAVHCTLIKDSQGYMYDPDFKGVKITNLTDYTGRDITILRYKFNLHQASLEAWCKDKFNIQEGYDYSQWLFGFVFGLRVKQIADAPNKWTCAEFPYWAFQETGHTLTLKEELLPMPRLFKYSPNFDVIFEGRLQA